MKNKIMDRYYKGCALDAYKLFGAHLCEERGKKGVRFTVYAPHAQGIQVIGSFDDWSCKGHPCDRFPYRSAAGNVLWYECIRFP